MTGYFSQLLQQAGVTVGPVERTPQAESPSQLASLEQSEERQVDQQRTAPHERVSHRTDHHDQSTESREQASSALRDEVENRPPDQAETKKQSRSREPDLHNAPTREEHQSIPGERPVTLPSVEAEASVTKDPSAETLKQPAGQRKAVKRSPETSTGLQEHFATKHVEHENIESETTTFQPAPSQESPAAGITSLQQEVTWQHILHEARAWVAETPAPGEAEHSRAAQHSAPERQVDIDAPITAHVIHATRPDQKASPEPFVGTEAQDLHLSIGAINLAVEQPENQPASRQTHARARSSGQENSGQASGRSRLRRYYLRVR